jgi:hypothetical protein
MPKAAASPHRARGCVDRGGEVGAAVTKPDATNSVANGDAGSGKPLDEVEHPTPGVLGLGGKGILLPIEEGVRGTVVDHHLVVDAGVGESVPEPLDLLQGYPRVITRHQGEHRACHLGDAIHRCLSTGWTNPAGVAVEADRPSKAVTVGRLLPCVAPAEAKADHKDRPIRIPFTQAGDSSRRVLSDTVGRHLLDVRHELEPVVAWPGARGPGEVVDSQRVHATLGETISELAVEGVQATDIR